MSNTAPLPIHIGRLDHREILPPAAAIKLDMLRGDREMKAAAVAVLPPQERLDLLAETQAAHADLSRLQAAAARGLTDEGTVAQARKKYERIRSDYDRRTALWEDAQEALRPAARLLDRIERKVAEQHAAGRPLALFTGAPYRAKKGERPRNVAERARAEREGHVAEFVVVNGAPRPVAESLEIARAWVAQWADLGKPDVFDLIERRNVDALAGPGRYALPTDTHAPVISLPIFVPHLGVAMPDGAAGLVQGQLPDFGSFLCWLDPDRVLAKLEAEIRLRTDEAAAIPEAERIRRERDLRGLIIAAERLEEAAIMAAASEGDVIARRADATPFVVLDLEIDDPARHLKISA